MKKFTQNLKILIFFLFWIFLMGFSMVESLSDYANAIQKKLVAHYDASPERTKIKQYELNVTNNGFCRYKRYFSNGKVEYYAFSLTKFKDLDYYGDAISGQLYLRTKSDDVIVQTYNDKVGNVDSMATYMVIPLKNMEPTELNELSETLKQMNKALLTSK